MTRKLWTATLNTSSPRYADWRKILGSDEVPITNAKPFAAQLGPDMTEIYKLDFDRLSHAQLERLAAWIVEKFGVSKREAHGRLSGEGFPIRAADVSVCFDVRLFV